MHNLLVPVQDGMDSWGGIRVMSPRISLWGPLNSLLMSKVAMSPPDHVKSREWSDRFMEKAAAPIAITSLLPCMIPRDEMSTEV